ncbi:MAG: pantoate--beta-alanine ligase [Myxococcota bacterium]|jgi:pantoate--beta-alanine ligase|nr:pantoate--beta-alanine ligase [Myxococcota bacterium]
MQVVRDPKAFREACEAARVRGERVGLVPTMGALHEGHLSLVDRARSEGATFVALTIFVNPLQFAAHEDLGRYPRTLEADLEACRSRGVDLVLVPEDGSMYPPGFQTEVAVGGITKRWEGVHRPSHFAGVTTVVCKLFALTGPCVAVFGRKDYQQWRVIERMTLDLDLPIEVIGHPIVREEDGLALSSRNRYLSPEERTRALGIARGLHAANEAWRAGMRDADALAAIVRGPVEAAFDSIDYVAVASPRSLEPIDGSATEAVILVAAHVGRTRLIDNLELA